MPEEPGVDLLEVGAMAAVISSLVIGKKSRGGKGGGSSGWRGATCGRSVTKNRCCRAVLICTGLWESMLWEVRSGGIRLIERPLRHVAASHKFLLVV